MRQDLKHNNLHRRSGVDPPQLPAGITTWRDAISAIDEMIAVRKVEIARLEVMSKAFRQAAKSNTPYPNVSR